jgi:hypothetical protein
MTRNKIVIALSTFAIAIGTALATRANSVKTLQTYYSNPGTCQPTAGCSTGTACTQTFYSNSNCTSTVPVTLKQNC